MTETKSTVWFHFDANQLTVIYVVLFYPIFLRKKIEERVLIKYDFVLQAKSSQLNLRMT